MKRKSIHALCNPKNAWMKFNSELKQDVSNKDEIGMCCKTKRAMSHE